MRAIHQWHQPPRCLSWTPVLSLQPGPAAELCRSWKMSWWWSVSLWESLLCSYFSAALLPLNTCTAMCSCRGTALLCRSGWWTAFCEDSQETSLPVSPTAAEDGFYFSEHIRSSSTAWCSAYCQLLGLLVKEGCSASWNAALIFALSLLLQMSLFN